MKTTTTSLQGNWFLLSSHPEKLYPAVGESVERRGHLGSNHGRPGGSAVAVIADPAGKYRAFVIDSAGRCTLLDTEGQIARIARIEPDHGRYDLGQMGWTVQQIAARESHGH